MLMCNALQMVCIAWAVSGHHWWVTTNEHLVRRELVAMVQICVHRQMLVDSTQTPAPKVECLDPFQQLSIAMMTNFFHSVMLTYVQALMLMLT